MPKIPEPFYLEWREEKYESPHTPAAPMTLYLKADSIGPLVQAVTAWLSRPCLWGHKFKFIDSERVACTRCYRIWREEL